MNEEVLSFHLPLFSFASSGCVESEPSPTVMAFRSPRITQHNKPLNTLIGVLDYNSLSGSNLGHIPITAPGSEDG